MRSILLSLLLVGLGVRVARAQDVVFFPGHSVSRGVQYGAELRWGDSLRRSARIPGADSYTPIDLTSVQLEVLAPFSPLEGFLAPHIGASWGNYGVPAQDFIGDGMPLAAGPHGASRAWSFDFGLALTWIVLTARPYGANATSLFNLELGVDLVAAVSTMRTGSAAGGGIDVESDFLLDVRPLVRFVFFLDRQWSAYVGAQLSMYDLFGADDFIHGHAADGTDVVARRGSQFTIGVQFNPGGRVVAPAR